MAAKNLHGRLRRAESFLGIHFDFHAGEDCKQVGKGVTRRMVAAIIDRVKPDYIQCDCKGHPGISSYPTKVGNPAPGFVRDQLRIWRDVTAERGVALFMHYSGVWDSEAIRRHPSWARINADGKRDKNGTSVFGPYVDRLLIPQLKELSSVYGVDGVWTDGDCWAHGPDWSRNAIEAFRRKTGIRKIPRKPEDPGFPAFLQFCRDGFRAYLDHWVTELHRYNPDFQAASNWAYTSFMPEPVGTGVDFISGDYSLQNSVNAARFEARCLVNQGKPWDLMAWSFSGKWGGGLWTTKTPVQLMQEAAAVLAVGGGFQAYFQQKRDGSICEWQMGLMAEVAKFCRARQPFCHRARPVPQVGLLLSTAGYYSNRTSAFAPWHGQYDALKGALQALLDSQLSVEIVMEHHLADRIDAYPLLVVPEWGYLAPAFRRKLVRYVEKGGSLLVIGPLAAKMFRKELRVAFVGKSAEKVRYLEHNGWLGGLKTVAQDVRLLAGAQAFGRMFADNDSAGAPLVPASVAKLGRGKIAALYVAFGERYLNGATATAREFLAALARELFPHPLVEVTGARAVELQVNRIDGRLMINLVNTGGPHANEKVYTFDEIPPAGPLTVSVRLARRPKSITVQPSGTALSFAFRKGVATFRIPRVAIHDIVVVA